MGVLTALAILAGLIVVHEAGHFFAATWQGIRVSGFSVGFGPVLLERQRRGVQFALRAIPLGGFVSFPDDDEDSPIPAGFSSTPGVLVAGVQGGQAAAAAGLRGGDRILAVNGQDLGGGQSAVAALVEQVKGAPSQTLRLQAERGNERLTLSLTPADVGGIGRIGAQLQPSGSERFRRAQGPGEILHQANADFTSLCRRTVEGFLTLATHFGETAGQVSGPVKIVEMGASLAKQGGSSLFLYTALISINLAVLNALPLPLLDGGQFVLLLLEGVRGKPLPERFQLAFMQSGFVFLVGLSVVLIVKDTSQLAAVQQLLGR